MSEEGVQALLMCISQRPCGQSGVFKLASLFLWTPLVVTLPPLHIMDDTAHVFFFCETSFSLLLAGGGISLLLLPGGILQLMAVIKDSRCSLQQTLLIQNKKRNARCIWSMQNSNGSGGVYEHKRALIAALVYKT